MSARTTLPRTFDALGGALVLVAAGLALTTAYIHLTLGGTLFTLNAVGFAVLAVAVLVSTVPHPLARRLAWAPRVALVGYTVTTIAAYLVMGPYFSLGWVAKAVEIGLVIVLTADLLRLYRSPGGLFRGIGSSLTRAAG